jgi:uncharacterized protein YkwD
MSIPSEQAVPKPHPARHIFGAKGMVVLTLVILVAFVTTTYIARDLMRSGGLAAVVTATLVDLANSDRDTENLGTLTISPKLVVAAQAKADDMAAKGYFAHNSPEGLTSWHWFSEADYSFSYAGENLAVNFSDSEDVERAWMQSPTHRANIMNGRFTEIGIATAVGEYKGKETVFVVQMFGTPRTAPVATAPTPITPAENPEDIAIATTEPDPSSVPVDEPSEEPASVGATAAPEENVVELVGGTSVPETGGVLAESADSVTRYAGPFESLLASPHGMLRTIYVLCALFVIGALLLLTRFELTHHHARHVVAAAFLIVLMSGLFVAADYFIFTDPTLTLTASAGVAR